MTLQPFKGAKSYLFKSAHLFKSITKTLEQISATHNYQPCYTSLIDHKSLYVSTLGDTSDIVTKEMFELNYKNYVLRPEGTANIMHYILKDSLHLKKPLPLKLYYIGPMFRHEKPQKGRYRQFWQYGLEYISNTEHPVQEADIIQMCQEFIDEHKLNDDLELNINTIGSSTDRNIYSRYIVDFFNDKPKAKSELSIDSLRRLEKNPIRLWDSKIPKDQEIIAELKPLSDFISDSSKTYFNSVKALLNTQNIKFTLNPYLVRGLDYYNDFCFEYMVKEQTGRSQNALIAGGRYNSLPEKITGSTKHNLKAIGFAMGIDRLIDHLGHKIATNDACSSILGLMVILEESRDDNSNLYNYVNQVEKLLKDNFIIDKFYVSNNEFGKGFHYFDSKKIRRCVIIGGNEIKSNEVIVRNLGTRDQLTVQQENLKKYLNDN